MYLTCNCELPCPWSWFPCVCVCSFIVCKVSAVMVDILCCFRLSQNVSQCTGLKEHTGLHKGMPCMQVCVDAITVSWYHYHVCECVWMPLLSRDTITMLTALIAMMENFSSSIKAVSMQFWCRSNLCVASFFCSRVHSVLDMWVMAKWQDVSELSCKYPCRSRVG